MPQFINVMPFVNSFYFSEAINNGLNILNQADYNNQILPWQWKTWYTAKSTPDDPITIQAHTAHNPSSVAPELFICDVYQNVIAAIDLNSTPYQYRNGYQTITGNVWTDPFTGASTQLDTTMWSFKFGDFASDLPVNNYYYLKLVAYIDSDSKAYFSEPIYLRAEHKNTQLFSCTYNANRAGNTNVVVTGWGKDTGSTVVVYYPEFAVRCESYILPIDPKAVNVGYLQQLYQQVYIFGQQTPMRTLKLGEISFGIPDYMLQMITEVLLADNFYIGNTYATKYCYTIYNPSAQTSPSDMWKSSRDENRPTLRAATVITVRYLAQQAMVDPVPAPTGHIYYGIFSDVFA